MVKPLAIDLFAGLGGWTEGLLAEGYDVVGIDIERHVYGGHRYPAQLVLQDVLTLHGAQFKDAALIVASPPCQEYSYMAMPWKRAKAIDAEYRSGVRDVKKLTALFDACFRIQREACEAAGHHIPMVVENVRGAQKWVGRAQWHFGSFYLWGDVPAIMPMTKVAPKVGGFSWSDFGKPGYKAQAFNGTAERELTSNKGIPHRPTGHWTNPEESGTKQGSDWFGSGTDCSLQRRAGSKSKARKAASAMIAKIPLVLARHIARSWMPI